MGITLEAGQIVLVGPGDGRYAGLLGFTESPSYGGQAGVWFRQQGAPPAQFALLDVADLTVVGAMPGAGPDRRTASAVRGERDRALAVVRLVRAEAAANDLTAAEACDEISGAVERGEVARRDTAAPPPGGSAGTRLRTTLAQAVDEVSENGFAAGVRYERERVLAIIAGVRAEAVSHANTAYGSGSEGPENAGRWRACDAIAAAIRAGG